MNIFAVIVVLLIAAAILWGRAEVRKEAKRANRVRNGVISSVDVRSKFFGGDLVTLFLIEEEHGRVYRAGIYGTDPEIENGKVIEFVADTSKVVGWESYATNTVNADGTKSTGSAENIYLGIKNYRIIDLSDFNIDETVIEGEVTFGEDQQQLIEEKSE
jgi:hypothetical protein